MAEYDLAIDIKGTQNMCCLAVIESVEAAAQGLAIDRYRTRDGRALGRAVRETEGMVVNGGAKTNQLAA